MTQPRNNSPFGCILRGCLILAILGIGSCGAFIFGIASLIKNSEPYREGLSLVQENETAIELIGEPIDAGFFVSGSINLNNDDGEADLSFSVSGPDGSGTVHVVGTKTNGVWTYSIIEFQPEDGSSRIELLLPQ